MLAIKKFPLIHTGDDGNRKLIAVNFHMNGSSPFVLSCHHALQHMAATITYYLIDASGKYTVGTFALVYQTSGFFVLCLLTYRLEINILPP